MSPTPLQVLCACPQQPDLATSAFGPFVIRPAASLAEVDAALDQHGFDALLLDLGVAGGLEALLRWPGLPRAVFETAVLVLGPEPLLADCLRLLQAGVRDVLTSRSLRADGLDRELRLVIERKRLDDAARRAFGIDLATGLPNHHQLLEHMTHLLALREREPAPMALVALQLDGMAAAETALGAEAANVLRRKAAVRLRSTLRASDVVASLGRDMFAVLLAWMDHDDDAERVARKLMQTAGTPFQVAGQPVPLGMRYGLAQYPAHGRDAQALLKRAVAQAGAGGSGRPLGSGLAANDD